MNLRKERAWLVCTSLGINCQMIAFLDLTEQLELQTINKFFYESAVGRVQSFIRVDEPYYFMFPPSYNAYIRSIFVYNHVTRKTRRATHRAYNFTANSSVIQV